MITILAIVLGVIFVFVTLFYLLSLKTKTTAIADIAWGLGPIVIAITTLLITRISGYRQTVTLLLVILWGFRLALHIYSRNEGKEDFRYEEWKKKWGRAWKIKSYLYVFLLQGLLMIVLSLPIIAINTEIGSSIDLLTRVGLLVWVVGFYFEALGDYQLRQFKKAKANKNKILKTGLWRYTRHPNYFGESAMWWGIYFIALSNLNSWWTIISPIFITFSLLKVSGVTLLEKHYKGNKEYREYQRTTSAFVPWWPKK